MDVLPAEEEDAEDIARALSLPLQELNRATAARLDPDHPVIVSCWDSKSDMNPRAAWRLDSLGFEQVDDYVAGETDRCASGARREGKGAAIPRAGDVARRDVSPCGLRETIGTARERLGATGGETCLVLNEERVVLGRLRADALAAAAETPVEQVMEAGPTTVRPDARLAEVAERMRAKQVADVVVTSSDGRLVGLLTRADTERAAGR